MVLSIVGTRLSFLLHPSFLLSVQGYGTEITASVINQHALMHGPVSVIMSFPAVIDGKSFAGDHYFYPEIVVDKTRVSDLDCLRLDYSIAGLQEDVVRLVVTAQLSTAGGYLLATPGEHEVMMALRSEPADKAYQSATFTVVAHRDDSAVPPLTGDPERHLVRSLKKSAFKASPSLVEPQEWLLADELGDSFLGMQARAQFAGVELHEWRSTYHKSTTPEEVTQLNRWLLAIQPAAAAPRLGIYAVEARLTRAWIKDALDTWDGSCDGDMQDILKKQIPGMSLVADRILRDHQDRVSPPANEDAGDTLIKTK